MYFFKRKEIDFNLVKVITDSVNWKYPSKQTTNELLPSQGIIDIEHLKGFSKTLFSYIATKK